MPITKFPPELKIPKTLPCHLCQAQIPPAKATLGPTTPDTTQLYAHAAHLQQSTWQYVLAWIDVIILYRSSSFGSDYMYGAANLGGIHARPVC